MFSRLASSFSFQKIACSKVPNHILSLLQKRHRRKSVNRRNSGEHCFTYKMASVPEELFDVGYENEKLGTTYARGANDNTLGSMNGQSKVFLDAVQEVSEMDPSLTFTVLDEDIENVFGKKPGFEATTPEGFTEESSVIPIASESDISSADVEMRTVNIFDSSPLGIFTDGSFYPQEPETKTSSIWTTFYEDELQKANRPAIKNWFQECINLTNEGKLWKFPINNEQDVTEGVDVPFEDHVLLERFLTGFPQNEKVQEFMKIVVLGLSKNCYLSAEEKRAHINWFRDYLKKKAFMLDKGK